MIEVGSQDPDRAISRMPLNPGEPTTLIGIYEQVLRDYPKTDTLNYKQEGAWQSVSAAEMLERARNLAACMRLASGKAIALRSSLRAVSNGCWRTRVASCWARLPCPSIRR